MKVKRVIDGIGPVRNVDVNDCLFGTSAYMSMTGFLWI